MKNTYAKVLTPVYVVNIIFQSFISLISPAAVMLLIAFLLDRYTSVGSWIYAVLITVGIVCGFFSMISFVLKAMSALEAIEKQNAEKIGKKEQTKNEQQN
jgi:F0F1-type ATP synthase assembly protein I